MSVFCTLAMFLKIAYYLPNFFYMLQLFSFSFYSLCIFISKHEYHPVRLNIEKNGAVNIVVNEHKEKGVQYCLYASPLTGI